MKIKVYGKKRCPNCAAAKDELRRLALPFEDVQIDNVMDYHESWKTDGTPQVLAAYAAYDAELPIIQIDDDFFNYSRAIQRLRAMHDQLPSGS